MTYARSRLWLGISGVGTLVIVSVTMILVGIPYTILPDNPDWRITDLTALLAFIAGYVLFMLPFDFLGGYLLPKRYSRESIRLAAAIRRWAVGVATQSILFLGVGLAILAAGRAGGLAAAVTAVGAVAIAFLVLQGLIAQLASGRRWFSSDVPIAPVNERLRQWNIPTVEIVAVDHDDPGFTGGVIGFFGKQLVVVPRQWRELLSADELAAVVARRGLAISTGSRFLGTACALTWVVGGFTLSALLPSAGVQSVAGLVTTLFGFTCWAFLGLLVLPTLSRMAAYKLDQMAVDRGIPSTVLQIALKKLDQLQDDEPERSAWIEGIFHPVPSIGNRQHVGGNGGLATWHVARTMLFLSWACLGLLSRAVHCNAGRPELWVLLPTD